MNSALTLLLSSPLLFSLFGCGLAPDTPVSQLDEVDWTRVCKAYQLDQAPASCGLFELSAPATRDECVNEGLTVFAGCDFTIDEHRQCMDARIIDPCNALYAEICQPVARCIQERS